MSQRNKQYTTLKMKVRLREYAPWLLTEITDRYASYADTMKVSLSQFLSHGIDPLDRYVVLSVDPAAGGDQSREAIIIFVTQDERVCLCGSYIVPQHNTAYAMPMMPNQNISFLHRVVYDFVRQNRSTLLTNRKSLPPVMLVIENNFGYGTDQYRQYFHNVKFEFELLIATPVYGYDQYYTQLAVGEAEAIAFHESVLLEQKDALRNIREEWEKGKNIRIEAARQVQKKLQSGKVKGLNIQTLIKKIHGIKDVTPEKIQQVLIEENILEQQADGDMTLSELYNRGMETNNDGDSRWYTLASTLANASIRLAEATNTRKQAVAAMKRYDDGRLHPFIEKPKHWNTLPNHFLQKVNFHGQIQRRVVFNEKTAYSDTTRTIFGFFTQNKSRFYRLMLYALGITGTPHMHVLPELMEKNETGTWTSAYQTLWTVINQFKHLSIESESDVESGGRVLEDNLLGSDVILLDGRVRGKESGERDDVYMSFSIGVTWCIQFTQLLASSRQRWTLVDYTRRLNKVSSSSIAAFLDDTRLMIDRAGRNRKIGDSDNSCPWCTCVVCKFYNKTNGIVETNVVTTASLDPSKTNDFDASDRLWRMDVNDDHDHRQVETHSKQRPTDMDIDDGVVDTQVQSIGILIAWFKAFSYEIRLIEVVYKRMIGAYIVEGHEAPSGYTLQPFVICRRSRGPNAKWKDAVVGEIQRLENILQGKEYMTELHRRFAVPSTTLRLSDVSCGMQRTWPCHIKLRTQKGQIHTIPELLDFIRNRLHPHLLSSWDPIATQIHSSHQLWANQGATSNVKDSLQKIQHVLDNCTQIWDSTSVAIREVASSKDISVLMKEINKNVGRSVSVTNSAYSISMQAVKALLQVKMQVCYWLRRERKLLEIQIYKTKSMHSTKSWKGYIQSGNMQLHVALTEYDRMLWRQIYRTLYPDKYEDMEKYICEGRHPSVYLQGRFNFDASGI